MTVSDVRHVAHLSIELDRLLEEQSSQRPEFDENDLIENILIRSIHSKSCAFETKNSSLFGTFYRLIEKPTNMFRKTRLYDIHTNLEQLKSLLDKIKSATVEQKIEALSQLPEKERNLALDKYNGNFDRLVSTFYLRIDKIRKHALSRLRDRVPEPLNSRIFQLKNCPFEEERKPSSQDSISHEIGELENNNRKNETRKTKVSSIRSSSSNNPSIRKKLSHQDDYENAITDFQAELLKLNVQIISTNTTPLEELRPNKLRTFFDLLTSLRDVEKRITKQLISSSLEPKIRLALFSKLTACDDQLTQMFTIVQSKQYESLEKEAPVTLNNCTIQPGTIISSGTHANHTINISDTDSNFQTSDAKISSIFKKIVGQSLVVLGPHLAYSLLTNDFSNIGTIAKYALPTAFSSMVSLYVCKKILPEKYSKYVQPLVTFAIHTGSVKLIKEGYLDIVQSQFVKVACDFTKQHPDVLPTHLLICTDGTKSSSTPEGETGSNLSNYLEKANKWAKDFLKLGNYVPHNLGSTLIQIPGETQTVNSQKALLPEQAGGTLPKITNYLFSYSYS